MVHRQSTITTRVTPPPVGSPVNTRTDERTCGPFQVLVPGVQL
jgi:hypothetical protein